MQKRGYLVIFSLLIISILLVAGCKEGAVGGLSKSNPVSKTPRMVNGACGSADGNSLVVAPSIRMAKCARGTSSVIVEISSGWTWVCDGSSGGTSASCSAKKKTPSVPPLVSTSSPSTTVPPASSSAASQPLVQDTSSVIQQPTLISEPILNLRIVYAEPATPGGFYPQSGEYQTYNRIYTPFNGNFDSLSEDAKNKMNVLNSKAFPDGDVRKDIKIENIKLSSYYGGPEFYITIPGKDRQFVKFSGNSYSVKYAIVDNYFFDVNWEGEIRGFNVPMFEIGVTKIGYIDDVIMEGRYATLRLRDGRSLKLMNFPILTKNGVPYSAGEYLSYSFDDSINFGGSFLSMEEKQISAIDRSTIDIQGTAIDRIYLTVLDDIYLSRPQSLFSYDDRRLDRFMPNQPTEIAPTSSFIKTGKVSLRLGSNCNQAHVSIDDRYYVGTLFIDGFEKTENVPVEDRLRSTRKEFDLNVPVGLHKIRAFCSGHQDYTKDVVVEADKTVDAGNIDFE